MQEKKEPKKLISLKKHICTKKSARCLSKIKHKYYKSIMSRLYKLASFYNDSIY